MPNGEVCTTEQLGQHILHRFQHAPAALGRVGALALVSSWRRGMATKISNAQSGSSPSTNATVTCQHESKPVLVPLGRTAMQTKLGQQPRPLRPALVFSTRLPASIRNQLLPLPGIPAVIDSTPCEKFEVIRPCATKCISGSINVGSCGAVLLLHAVFHLKAVSQRAAVGISQHK